MRALRYAIFFILIPFTGFAQSTNLVFQGYQEFRDTLQFSFDTLDFADMNHSRVFNIPANEVWIIDQSLMSFEISNSAISNSYYHNPTKCNCISLDGIILHNILNGEGKSHDWKSVYNDKHVPVYTNVPKATRTPKEAAQSSPNVGLLFGGRISSWYSGRPFGGDRLPRQISETFDTRLKLLSGVHVISGNVVITEKDYYSFSGISDPFWNPGAAYIIHNILFEKYTLE